VRITQIGIKAFEEYVKALQEYLKVGREIEAGWHYCRKNCNNYNEPQRGEPITMRNFFSLQLLSLVNYFSTIALKGGVAYPSG